MLYDAYGLIWSSPWALPFVAAQSDDKPDILLKAALTRPFPNSAKGLTRFDDGQWMLRMDDPAHGWADYVWDDATATMSVATSHSAEDCWPVLASMLPAILLCNGGHSLLHAAVVQIDGFIIAIVGSSGTGKSTLAAAMLARGALAMSDDVARIDLSEGEALVHIGYPAIGVDKDVATAIGAPIPQAPRFRHGDNKLQLDLAASSHRLARLDAIIVLSPFGEISTGASIEKLRPAASVAVIRANLFGGWIRPLAVHDLQFCMDLARSVPTYQLCRCSGFDYLDASCQLINDQLRDKG